MTSNGQRPCALIYLKRGSSLWHLKPKPPPRPGPIPQKTLNLTCTILTSSYLYPTITSMEMISIQKGLLPNSLNHGRHADGSRIDA